MWEHSLAIVLFACIASSKIIFTDACQQHVGAVDYQDALSKSILFFEGQRSGKLPSDQRVNWRGDSALSDGSLGNVDLTGGYYDAGDNVKFLWPMSFTVSLLSWAASQYGNELSEANQLKDLLQAIRWGADFIMKSHTAPTTLWTQVGDGAGDHECWERPEDMDTPRTLKQINASSPGTEVAADASAALSSAAIAWKKFDSSYSTKLLQDSQAVNIHFRLFQIFSLFWLVCIFIVNLFALFPQLFQFANQYRGTYNASCPLYCSYSGFQDELLWAASWLYKATRDPSYLQFVLDNQGWSTAVTEFSWDNKFAGVQILLAQEYLSGEQSLKKYKTDADSFLCALLPHSSTLQILTTPGGLLYIRNTSNLQYVTTASNGMMVYSDILADANIPSIQCGAVSYTASDIQSFAQSQVDYILGKNPLKMSYMVGFGTQYPQHLHHRGSSLPSIHAMPQKIWCQIGMTEWFTTNLPNPNVHVGAVVGGPDLNDQFYDVRSDYSSLEPATYINAGMVGSLAGLLHSQI